MPPFSLTLHPQYVGYTSARETFPDGNTYPLHRVQQLMRDEFHTLPDCTILTAPTGTGKSYAFPFPVLKDRQQPIDLYADDVKGLIVLPTNALIQELTANFQQTYPTIRTACLNGPTLDSMEKRGFQRFKAMVEVASSHDLVITNPDLLAYAMQDGYHQRRATHLRKWQKEKGQSVGKYQRTGYSSFPDFLDAFSYIIFDEYHLYDEAQIASIMTLLMLRDAYLQRNKQIRFLFASATPEPLLKEWLEKLGYTCQEIKEEIVSSPNQARPIHGPLQVYLHSGKDMSAWLREQIPPLLTAVEEGQRALIIFDKLNELQAVGRQINRDYPQLKVYESTGYTPKDEDSQAFIQQAQLILATNKAEVGVNYEVTYCLMQPGRFFQNFVQRFGRVSRGDKAGTIHILLNAHTHRKAGNAFPSPTDQLGYYAFLQGMRPLLQARTFYSQKIPQYLGEYLWCIRRSLYENHEFENPKPLQRLLDSLFWKHEQLGPARSRYGVMEQVHRSIATLVWQAFPGSRDEKSFRLDRFLQKYEAQAHHPAYQWAKWWQTYLQTYLRFREGGLTVELYDQERDQLLDYRLEWLLQYRQILGVETREDRAYPYQRYLIGGEKDRDRDLQYHVDSIPAIGEKANELLTYEEVNNEKKLKGAFDQAIAALKRRHLRGVQPGDEAISNLLPHLVQLGETFSRRRLNILTIYHNDALL